MIILLGLDSLDRNLQSTWWSDVGGLNYSENKVCIAANLLLLLTYLLTYLPCLVRRVGLVGRALDSWSGVGVPGSSPGDIIFRHVISLGKEFTHICSCHLRLSSFGGRKIEYQLRLGVMAGMTASVGWQVTQCDLIDTWFPVVMRCLAWTTNVFLFGAVFAKLNRAAMRIWWSDWAVG
jgi:hypothetical protein